MATIPTGSARRRPGNRTEAESRPAAATPVPAPFAVAVVENASETTVAPTGDLDMVTADAVDREIRRLLEGGCDRLVVDLSQVEFMDSTGLRALLSLRNDAKRNDHSLTLVPGPPAVQRVFALTGTRGLFDWRRS